MELDDSIECYEAECQLICNDLNLNVHMLRHIEFQCIHLVDELNYIGKYYYFCLVFQNYWIYAMFHALKF